MRAGTETGSLINHIATTAKQPTPEVGMGATICLWTDRHAATIVAITPKTVTVKRDRAICISGSAHDGSASYRYEPNPNPNSKPDVFRFRKTGGYRNNCGDGLWIGRRDEHHDPSS